MLLEHKIVLTIKQPYIHSYLVRHETFITVQWIHDHVRRKPHENNENTLHLPPFEKRQGGYL